MSRPTSDATLERFAAELLRLLELAHLRLDKWGYPPAGERPEMTG